MKLKQTYYAKVIDGKLQFEHEVNLGWELIELEGEVVEVEIRRFKDDRSKRQNAYYFGVVIPIFQDYFGMEKGIDVHEALKWEHLKKKVKDVRGVERWPVRSTADMKTDEFEDYMRTLRMWGAHEFALNIPEPNEPPLSVYENDKENI